MADHPERWSSPLTQVEMRKLWTYSDGSVTVKGYRSPGGGAGAGSWVLVDEATGNARGVVPPGEFSRRFRPVDLFADVPGLPTRNSPFATSARVLTGSIRGAQIVHSSYPGRRYGLLALGVRTA